jgi:glutamate carboxypeptidase
MPTSKDLRRLLTGLKSREGEMLGLLGRFVCAESPSDDKFAVDSLGRIVGAEWRRRGARVHILKQPERGNHLLVKLWRGPGRPAGRILLLGHLDTVYDKGAITGMPFRIARGRAWGPGTFDMKGGLVLALAAVDALARAGIHLRKEIACLWTSDEEIGSFTSRRAIEKEAKRSDAVLVLEPAGEPRGALKTSRKGVGEIELRVIGRAAHSGLKPEEGINAVHELALQIAKIAGWNQPRAGIGVHVNVASGGTRGNVIAAEARALIDARVSRASDMRRLEQRFHNLRPILRGARLEVSGGFSRPPMERKTSAELYERANELSEQLGIPISEVSVGGGSDGNITAALGVPTLDGLGAVGENAHSTGENILIRALAPRAALIAALIATL